LTGPSSNTLAVSFSALNRPLKRRTTLVGAAVALGCLALPATAQAKTVLRISTPAVPDAWHAKMWTVFKEALEKAERTLALYPPVRLQPERPCAFSCLCGRSAA
jgi:hypothetical protein